MNSCYNFLFKHFVTKVFEKLFNKSFLSNHFRSLYKQHRLYFKFVKDSLRKSKLNVTTDGHYQFVNNV